MNNCYLPWMRIISFWIRLHINWWLTSSLFSNITFCTKNIRKVTKIFTSNLSQNFRSVSYKTLTFVFDIQLWMSSDILVCTNHLWIIILNACSTEQLIEIICGINVLQLFINFCCYILYVSRYNAYLHWLLSWIKMFIQPILNFEIIHYKHMNKWMIVDRYVVKMKRSFISLNIHSFHGIPK